MDLKTGFYNIKNLSEEQLKAFFQDAVMLSYDSHVEILDCDISWRRQNTTAKTIKQMINDVSLQNHNVCVDRSIQHEIERVGEVVYRTSSKSTDYFLYCFLTLDNLKILTDKYSLIME